MSLAKLELTSGLLNRSPIDPYSLEIVNTQKKRVKKSGGRLEGEQQRGMIIGGGGGRGEMEWEESRERECEVG